MRYKINSYEHLIARLREASEDDLTRPWSDYPCLEWDRGRHTRGYGVIRLPKEMGLGMTRAHLLAFEVSSGPVPDGHEVCHHCDNPQCFRPLHLFSGSHSNNMQDMIGKGRRRKQTGITYKKLSPDVVREIRDEYLFGRTQKELAEDYGRSEKHIGSILRNESWVNV